MNFQSKKYFLVFLFSVTSMAVYSNIDQDDKPDLSQVTEGNNNRQLPETTTQVSQSQQMFDACLAYKNAMVDRCVSVKNQFQEMIHTVNRDPGLELNSGLVVGSILGGVNIAMLKYMKKFPRMQAVAMFAAPTAVVSYLVASRNERIRELEWICKQFKDFKKSE